MLPKGQRCHQINTEKQQVTFSADQSGWGWARCLWAWQSLLYWLHRGCISRILSTHSGDTEPLLGSPQICAPHAGASHLSLSAPPCHPSWIEKRFALKAQWILNMYQSALTLKWEINTPKYFLSKLSCTCCGNSQKKEDNLNNSTSMCRNKSLYPECQWCF